MNTVLQTFLTTSFHGSIVILAVLILRLVLRKAPKKFICMLWMLCMCVYECVSLLGLCNTP